MYTGLDVDKFYPLVYGEDIASVDSDEDKAGYNTFFSSSCKLELYMNLS